MNLRLHLTVRQDESPPRPILSYDLPCAGKWTPRARIRFRQATLYIAKDNPTAARDVADRVRKAANSLAAHPLMGREGQVIDTRELVVPRTPFTIAYRVTGQTTEIVGVIHQAQQWPETFQEADR